MKNLIQNGITLSYIHTKTIVSGSMQPCSTTLFKCDLFFFFSSAASTPHQTMIRDLLIKTIYDQKHRLQADSDLGVPSQIRNAPAIEVVHSVAQVVSAVQQKIYSWYYFRRFLRVSFNMYRLFVLFCFTDHIHLHFNSRTHIYALWVFYSTLYAQKLTNCSSHSTFRNRLQNIQTPVSQ